MKSAFISILLFACTALSTAGFFAEVPAHAEEAAAVKTIPAKEIKDEEGTAAATISAEEVEKARAVTAERIYWLIGLWLCIALAAVLIRWQLRDDDKLYREGYYSREL
jgi:hypothetical protein